MLSTKQAAIEGDQNTRRPRCHATRLASPHFAATPFVTPCPATPLITSPPWCPTNLQSPFPSPLPSIWPSLCHPPCTRSFVSPEKHVLVGLRKHARHTLTHSQTSVRRRKQGRGGRKRVITSNKIVIYNPVMHILGDMTNSAEIINKCMVYNNSVFNSRQVAD